MASMQILVVDDDPSIRRLVCAVLLRAGYSTDEAKNGDEAIAKLRESQYAAVVLDLMMPVRSGYEVIDFVSAGMPAMLPSVIVMTAAARTRIKEPLGASGVGRVLFKPFDINELLRLVQECAGDAGRTALLATGAD
jgi:CheY-like chemotaxis protein